MMLVLVLGTMLHLERSQGNILLSLIVPPSTTAADVHTPFTGQNSGWRFASLYFAIPGRFAMVRAPNRLRVNSESAEKNDGTNFMYKMMMASRY